MKILKSGQLATDSGIYAEVGPRGGKTGREVVAEKGEPLSPTSESGMGYVLVRKAKHNS